MKKYISDIAFYITLTITSLAFFIESYVMGSILVFLLLIAFICYATTKTRNYILILITAIQLVLSLILHFYDIVNGVFVGYTLVVLIISLTFLVPLTKQDMKKIRHSRFDLWWHQK